MYTKLKRTFSRSPIARNNARLPGVGHQTDSPFPEERKTYSSQRHSAHLSPRSENSPFLPETCQRLVNTDPAAAARRKYKDLPPCDNSDSFWDPPRDGVDKPMRKINNILSPASNYFNSRLTSSVSSISTGLATFSGCLFQDAFIWVTPVHMDVGKGKTSSVVVEGPSPVLESDIRERLRCLAESSNGPLEISIELRYDHIVPTAAREIMGEIIRLVKDNVSSLKLTVPSHASINSTTPDVVGSSRRASFDVPLLLDFSWTGDVKLLPSPWHSLSNLPFRQFRTLNLNCDLSIDDCTEILYRSDNLLHIGIGSLTPCESILKHLFQKHNGLFMRPKLKSLNMLFTMDCTALFDRVRLLGLVNAVFGSDKNSTLDWIASAEIPWDGLDSVTLSGRIKEISPFKKCMSHAKQRDGIEGDSILYTIM